MNIFDIPPATMAGLTSFIVVALLSICFTMVILFTLNEILAAAPLSPPRKPGPAENYIKD